ncbi:MAG: methyltransferase domain-containing protein [Candidatus Micrarchaeia archaeon]
MKAKMHLLHRELAESHFWFRGRKAVIDSLLSGLRIRGKRALEVGIGTGNMLGSIKGCGFGMVDGVDVHKNRHAKGYRHIYWERFEHFRPAYKYDAIFMFDALEHMHDDREALKRAYLLLKKGGCLVVTVPAIKWLWSKHDEDNMHYRRYELQGLKNTLEKERFLVVRATYFNTLLFPLVVLARKLGSGGLGKVNPILNWLLFELFALERHLVRFFPLPYGASLFVCAKKL